jgi:hypothetical protein
MQSFTEKQAEDFMEKNNFSVAKRSFAKTKSQLSKIKIPFPWVMKISSSKIMHKAKIGGVILNIESIEQAEQSYSQLSKMQFFEEVIVQEMIRGKEIVIGIKKTPEFGHIIMFGKGGSSVEKDKDVSFRIFPAQEKDIKEMIKETKISQELDSQELEQIKYIFEKIQTLIRKNPKLSELDINPLFVNDKNAIIADTRIVFT